MEGIDVYKLPTLSGPHVGFQKGGGEICKTPLIWATSN